jgi:hypothetical protein
MTTDTEDPRAERHGICGVTQITGRVEWVCIEPIHATEEDVRRGRPNAHRHYFVNRWPHRRRTVTA